MRSTKRRFALVVAGVAVALVATVSGTGTSSAQDHPHPTTTAPPGPTTTAPPGPTTTEDHPHPTTPTTAPGMTTTTAPPQEGSQETKIQYGPFDVQGAPANPDGTHGHVHTGNQFSLFIEKPCTNCYITGMTADLINADGTRAGWSTDAQLHHMVLFNMDFTRSDPTCAGSILGFLGQRFFASGDERTPIIAPAPYGYHVGWLDQWHMIWELANHNTAPQNDLTIEMTYNWVPDTTPGMRNVEPVWLDLNQCGTSVISVPAGPHSQSYTWNVNRPGAVIGIGGHLHDGGLNIDTRNDTTGEMICDSRAVYGGEPLYIGHHGEEHLSDMTVCTGTPDDPVSTIAQGDQVTMTGHYDEEEPDDHQMGIVVMYVDTAAT